MSQDVNQDWANRDFVESIEMAMRKCIDFLNDFHEQAKYRLSEVDSRLTSLERKADYIEAQLLNADPSQRQAKPKSFKGSTFDPAVRREQVKKFRERLQKTEKVFSDRIIAPHKQDNARGKLIIGGAKKSNNAPQEILGAPKNIGKGNIPIAKLAKSNSKPDGPAAAAAPPGAPGGPGPGGADAPKSKAAIAAAAIPMQPEPPMPDVPKPNANARPPPSAAEAAAAMAKKDVGGAPPVPPVPSVPPAVPNVPKPPVPNVPPAVPNVPQPPGPPPPGPGGPGGGGGDDYEPGAEGTSGTGGEGDDGDGGGGFPHGDPNAIDMQIIKPGNGNVPGAKSKVEVEYTGFLADGSKFIEHRETLSLGLKQNIKGLEAGLQRMQEGTFAKLWIPFKLAYGQRGAPPLIPAASDLTFEITLLRIVD